MHKNEILFNWTNQYEQLAAEDLAEWWANLEEPATANAKEFIDSGRGEERWLAARDMYHQNCLAQAKRMNLTPARDGFGHFNGTLLIERAVGYEDGQELIERLNFKSEAREPNSMWDIMDFRVDGEAVIGLVGDDRGWDEDWVYMIIVAWYPKEVWDKWEPMTALI